MIINYTDTKIEADGSYTGMLKFTFKDNFGLDLIDIKNFSYLSGFRSWFILQHSDEYKDKYKPFQTVVTLYYPVSGNIKEQKR